MAEEVERDAFSVKFEDSRGSLESVVMGGRSQ